MESLSNLDIINVQSTDTIIFQTTKQTLLKSPWFQKYFNEIKVTNVIKLDIDGKAVEILLDYLRNARTIPKDYLGTLFQYLPSSVQDLEFVTLNVGGEKFFLPKKFLSMHSDYFHCLFQQHWKPEKEYFIDQNPKIFKHIVTLLKTGNIKEFPTEYLTDLLDFYQIDLTNLKSSADVNIQTIEKKDTKSNDICDHDDQEQKNILQTTKNIVRYSALEMYFTGNPQITHFKTFHRRCTYFNKCYLQQNVILESNNVYTCILSKNMDFVRELYVTIIFETDPRIEKLCEFIPNVEALFFEDISVHFHHKSNEKKSLYQSYSGESNYVRHLFPPLHETKSAKTLQKLIIPLGNLMDPNPVLFNRYLPDLLMYFKVNSMNKLVCADPFVLATINNSIKIKSMYLTGEINIPDEEELKRYDAMGHEFLIKRYKSFNVPVDQKSETQEIIIGHEPVMSIQQIYIYIRKIGELDPIHNSNFLREFEIICDSVSYVKLDGDLLKKMTNQYYKDHLIYEYVYKFGLHKGQGNNCTFIDSYDYPLLPVDNMGHSITFNSHVYKKVSMQLKINQDITGDHEIVVVCEGENVLRIINHMASWAYN